MRESISAMGQDLFTEILALKASAMHISDDVPCPYEDDLPDEAEFQGPLPRHLRSLVFFAGNLDAKAQEAYEASQESPRNPDLKEVLETAQQRYMAVYDLLLLSLLDHYKKPPHFDRLSVSISSDWMVYYSEGEGEAKRIIH